MFLRILLIYLLLLLNCYCSLCFRSATMSNIGVMISNPWQSPTEKQEFIVENTDLVELAKKVASGELREDDNAREQCIQQFKEWIQKNADIENCITGNC